LPSWSSAELECGETDHLFWDMTSELAMPNGTFLPWCSCNLFLNLCPNTWPVRSTHPI
jgi:hypothetical protein